MSESIDNLYSKEYFEYLHKRNSLRKFLRKFYLRDIRGYCIGKTIDFGCGTGELLAMLPEGSIGFEVNKVATEYCRSIGLNVMLYDPEKDDYQFGMLEKGIFATFTMNHVLEHIENTSDVVRKIFDRCFELGIKRIVFTVPGYKGYLSDDTHRTFIDRKYLKEHDLLDHQNYRLKRSKYFPINFQKFSRHFTHNELRLIFDRND